MADGQLFKPEKDYTKEVDKQVPEAEELAKVYHLRFPVSKKIANVFYCRAMFSQL